MSKFFTGIVYTLGTGLSCLVAWEHAVTFPEFVSGYIGFAAMALLPQVMGAMIVLAFTREG